MNLSAIGLPQQSINTVANPTVVVPTNTVTIQNGNVTASIDQSNNEVSEVNSQGILSAAFANLVAVNSAASAALDASNKLREIQENQLIELKKTNIHLSEVTGEKITERDL